MDLESFQGSFAGALENQQMTASKKKKVKINTDTPKHYPES